MALQPKVTRPASARPLASQYASSGGSGIATAKQKMQIPVVNYQTFKTHLMALKGRAGELPAPPDAYDPEKRYVVQLRRAIQVPKSGVWIRPVHEVVLDGAFAATIADDISGAKEL